MMKYSQLYFGNFIEIKLLQYLCLKISCRTQNMQKYFYRGYHLPHIKNNQENKYIFDASPNKTQNIKFCFCSDLNLCFFTTDNNLFLVSTLVSGCFNFLLLLFYQLKVDLTKATSLSLIFTVTVVMTNLLDHPLNIH